MTKYIYITRHDQILACVADSLGDNGWVALAPYYDKTLNDWEQAAKTAFGEFGKSQLLGMSWEYNGSSSYHPDEKHDFWVVKVYESPKADFEGLDALVSDFHTVECGYVEFVDQDARYEAAVADVETTAMSEHSDQTDLEEVVSNVFAQARDRDEPACDIVDAFDGTDWAFIDSAVVAKTAEAA